MRFDVVTLFPELFTPFLSVGITRRAFASGHLNVQCSNPRDFATGSYRRVDDRPFGGGPGMVMMAEPLEQAIGHIRTQRNDPAPVVLFSPHWQAAGPCRRATLGRQRRRYSAVWPLRRH